MTTKQLTTTEADRLRRAYARVENARNFTAEAAALDKLNAMQERLLAKGIDADTIIAAQHDTTAGVVA